MMRKLAVKKLSASDLTFFEHHYRIATNYRQKAINLNADIFIDKFYPNLDGIAGNEDRRLPIKLTISGPGLCGEYNLNRTLAEQSRDENAPKIITGKTYKNWRLNGGLVTNPPEAQNRFDALQPGDIVIFDFEGEPYPESAKAVFLARILIEDRILYEEINVFIDSKTMMHLSTIELERLINQANPPHNHPIYELIIDDEVEDAALGSIKSIQQLRKKASKRAISAVALENARKKAGVIGKLGEDFINSYLKQQENEGFLISYEWASATNAIEAYDFKAKNEEVEVLIEVKSTEGPFSNSIHISFNELLKMAEENVVYDLYRVFEIDSEGKNAKLRIASNIGDFARKVIETLRNLPQGITPDSITVIPSILPFEEETMSIALLPNE